MLHFFKVHWYPTMEVDLFRNYPNFSMPLVVSADWLHISQPGTEPALRASSMEANRLLGGYFSQDKAVKADLRRRYFSDAENLRGYEYRRGLVYTFVFAAEYIDMETFEFKIPGVAKWDLNHHLAGQSLCLFAWNKQTKRPLFSVEAWSADQIDEAGPFDVPEEALFMLSRKATSPAKEAYAESGQPTVDAKKIQPQKTVINSLLQAIWYLCCDSAPSAIVSFCMLFTALLLIGQYSRPEF